MRSGGSLTSWSYRMSVSSGAKWGPDGWRGCPRRGLGWIGSYPDGDIEEPIHLHSQRALLYGA